MATKYLRSTDGNDADDGSTWALAKALTSALASSMAAGDIGYMSQAHSESSASAVTITFPGTLANPNYLLCGDDAAEPPTASATAGKIATTGASNITMNGSVVTNGVQFQAGSAASNFANIFINDSSTLGFQWHRNARFFLQDQHPSGRIKFNNQSAGYGHEVRLDNPTFRLSNTSQYIALNGVVRINGGSFESGTAAGTGGWFGRTASATGTHCDAIISQLDFSNCSATGNLLTTASGETSGQVLPFTVVFDRCTLPASWTGNLVAAAGPNPRYRADMVNCQISGGAKIRVWRERGNGTVRDELTIVRTSGFTDGATAVALRAVSNANASRAWPLEVYEIRLGVAASSTTLTLELQHASVGSGTAGALTNRDFFVDVLYPGGIATSRPTEIIAAASDLTSSSAAWGSAPAGTPLKQKIELTFTPSSTGEAVVRLFLAKASSTVYICPKVV